MRRIRGFRSRRLGITSPTSRPPVRVQQNRRSGSTYDPTGRPRQARQATSSRSTPIIPDRKPAARTEGNKTGPPSKPLQQPRRYHPAIYKSRRLESNTTNTTRSPRRPSASQPAQPTQPQTQTVRDLVTQPARKQQTNEWQSTQPSMRPTTPTGPLTHRPETQNQGPARL